MFQASSGWLQTLVVLGLWRHGINSRELVQVFAGVSFIGKKLVASFVENASHDHKRCSPSTVGNVCIIIWNQLKFKRAWRLRAPGLIEKAFGEALQGLGSSAESSVPIAAFCKINCNGNTR